MFSMPKNNSKKASLPFEGEKEHIKFKLVGLLMARLRAQLISIVH